MKKQDIKSMELSELTDFVEALGEKPFRARQLYRWMHAKTAASFEEMTDLSQAFRERLAEAAGYTVLKTVKMLESGIDGTRKYLFGLEDGNVIESVFMRYHHGNSVCVSSQVGCRMGCKFCASTLDGLTRNLTPAEMLEQVYRIQASTGERVSNVVVMGSGEPFDNYENLVRFIRLLSDENGLHISQRNITVSTCGLVPQIRRFANYYLPDAVRILELYARLEGQDVQGGNAASVRREVETNAASIATAFENQLDSLFAADALDLSADLEVLNGMLRGQGLAGSDFAQKPEEQ